MWADCKIFPTGLTTGVPDGLLWEIPIEGYVIFGRSKEDLNVFHITEKDTPENCTIRISHKLLD